MINLKDFTVPSDILASIAPVAGSPLIGFGDVPADSVSLIDLFGINDATIPYDHAHAKGESSSSFQTIFQILLISVGSIFYSQAKALYLIK